MNRQRTWLYWSLAALCVALTCACGGGSGNSSSGNGGEGGSSKVCVFGESKIGSCTLAP